MKKSLLVVVLAIVVFLSVAGCKSQSIPEQSATPELSATLEPSATPEPTPTIDNSGKKRELARDFGRLLYLTDAYLSVYEVTWVGDELKFKGYLQGFVIEPEDHGQVHFEFLKKLATDREDFFDFDSVKRDELLEFDALLDENSVIVIVSEAKFNGTETLSITKYSTFQKIINGEITTEVEWRYEAEVFVS